MADRTKSMSRGDDIARCRFVYGRTRKCALTAFDRRRKRRLEVGVNDDIQTLQWQPAKFGAQLRDIEAWPDSWLIEAVRRDPPDLAALDALANRYWRQLFGR